MNNDRIQGILFDQSELIDLTPRTRKQRFISRLTATRYALQTWRIRSNEQKAILLAAQAKHPLFSQKLSKKQYEYEMGELLNRLKTRD